MKPKHTPAPWFAVDYAGSFCIQNGEMYEDKDILTYDDIWDKDAFKKEEVEANTKLICAAPGLLEAIQNLLGFMDTPIMRRKYAGNYLFDNSILEAKNALKKATE